MHHKRRGISVRVANQTWANEIEIHSGREDTGHRDRETQGSLHTHLDTLAHLARIRSIPSVTLSS